jgi:ribosomal protein S18 acetylase RimI-like enzyme
MELRALADGDFGAVHAAFVEAFSDYVVKLAPTPEGLREMLTRRGWVPEVSVGAYDGSRLVAFTLNALDGDAAYDSGTGVVPSHRRRGLAREMMEWSRARLRDAGARTYTLEVLEANHSAAALYRQCGFTETRRLQCWSYDSATLAAPGHGNIEPVWCDTAPSWQNSLSSVRRARDPHAILGDHHSFAVVFPSNGDVPLLAVDPAHRRRGLGRQLLGAARSVAGKPLRIMNVDDGQSGITAFLEHAGATRTVAQREMVLTITP